MHKDTILSLIRHALTFGGGIAVGKGLISGDALATLIPAVLAAVGGVWGAADEFLAARAAAKAKAAPAPVLNSGGL
jgi:hypothetical protein